MPLIHDKFQAVNTIGIRYVTCSEGSLYGNPHGYHIHIKWKQDSASLGFGTRQERDHFYDILISSIKGSTNVSEFKTDAHRHNSQED